MGCERGKGGAFAGTPTSISLMSMGAARAVAARAMSNRAAVCMVREWGGGWRKGTAESGGRSEVKWR